MAVSAAPAARGRRAIAIAAALGGAMSGLSALAAAALALGAAGNGRADAIDAGRSAADRIGRHTVGIDAALLMADPAATDSPRAVGINAALALADPVTTDAVRAGLVNAVVGAIRQLTGCRGACIGQWAIGDQRFWLAGPLRADAVQSSCHRCAANEGAKHPLERAAARCALRECTRQGIEFSVVHSWSALSFNTETAPRGTRRPFRPGYR